ncbi:MAG: hypothetical protein ACR2PI_11085 [Hyphomicrobiaceae bacterium]
MAKEINYDVQNMLDGEGKTAGQQRNSQMSRLAMPMVLFSMAGSSVDITDSATLWTPKW